MSFSKIKFFEFSVQKIAYKGEESKYKLEVLHEEFLWNKFSTMKMCEAWAFRRRVGRICVTLQSWDILVWLNSKSRCTTTFAARFHVQYVNFEMRHKIF